MHASITAQKNGMVVAVLDAEAAQRHVCLCDIRGAHP